MSKMSKDIKECDHTTNSNGERSFTIKNLDDGRQECLLCHKTGYFVKELGKFFTVKLSEAQIRAMVNLLSEE